MTRRQLANAQAALAESEKECESTRSQLEAEQARCLRLEAELAELRQQMGAQREMEKEAATMAEKARRSAEEAEKAKSQRKGGGIWGLIAGNPPPPLENGK